MKKLLVIITLTMASLTGSAQWLWDFGGTAAACNYLGDIGGKDKTRRDFVSDMKLAKTRWNFGGFARYKFRSKLSLKASVDYLRLEGDDALSTNPGRRYRNFNFRNDIADMGLTAEYFFFENNDIGNTYRYRNGFRAYIFAGVGGFYSNPKTLYRDEWVALRPYATEGVQYKSFVATIPMGIGFYFTLNKKQRIGFEVNYRKTFTDYLDDISTSYPSDPGNDYERGLILRTRELDQATKDEDPAAMAAHTWGAKRGGDQYKDAFLTVGFTYSYVLRGKSSFYRARNTGGFFSKKRKMRKIRAKF